MIRFWNRDCAFASSTIYVMITCFCKHPSGINGVIIDNAAVTMVQTTPYGGGFVVMETDNINTPPSVVMNECFSGDITGELAFEAQTIFATGIKEFICASNHFRFVVRMCMSPMEKLKLFRSCSRFLNPIVDYSYSVTT